jgi:hypothetical protein
MLAAAVAISNEFLEGFTKPEVRSLEATLKADLRQRASAWDEERQESRMNRKKMLLTVIGAFAVGVIAYGSYWSIALRNAESTDDAYVNGNVVQITSQVPAPSSASPRTTPTS